MMQRTTKQNEACMKLAATLLMSLVMVAGFAEKPTALTFEPLQSLSADPGFSSVPHIAEVGSNIYVVWLNGSIDSGGDILFRRSANRGASWGEIQNLSIRSGDSNYPRVVASDKGVYVVYEEFTPETGGWEAYIRRSIDGGATFDPPINLSAGVGLLTNPAFGIPDMAVSGTRIYVVWAHPFGGLQVFFRRSLDAGVTWSEIFQVSTAPGDHLDPHILAHETNLSVTWRCNLDYPEPSRVLTRHSSDGGMNWNSIQNLSYNGQGVAVHDIAGNGSNVYVVWSGSPANIYYRRSTDGGMTFDLN